MVGKGRVVASQQLRPGAESLVFGLASNIRSVFTNFSCRHHWVSTLGIAVMEVLVHGIHIATRDSFVSGKLPVDEPQHPRGTGQSVGVLRVTTWKGLYSLLVIDFTILGVMGGTSQLWRFRCLI